MKNTKDQTIITITNKDIVVSRSQGIPKRKESIFQREEVQVGVDQQKVKEAKAMNLQEGAEVPVAVAVQALVQRVMVMQDISNIKLDLLLANIE